VWDVINSCDNDLPYGLFESVKDAFTGLDLGGRGDGPLAFSDRIPK